MTLSLNRPFAAIATLALLAVIAGCQISGPDLSGSELGSLERRIMELIGDAPAQSASACRTIAFGKKPCGGPWSYLVYSAEHTNEDELIELVESYNRMQDRLNREQGLISDCAIVGEPEVDLVDGRCSAVP